MTNKSILQEAPDSIQGDIQDKHKEDGFHRNKENDWNTRKAVPLDSQIDILNSRTKNRHSRLRVAVLGTRGFPHVQGGVETHCEHLYHYLVKMGCEVLVFARKPYVNPGIHEYEGIKLIPLPCPKNKFLETFFHTLMGILIAKKYSPDVLHVHAIGPSLFIPVARLLGLKVIMTNHGPDYQRKKWGKLAKIILKLGEGFGSKWANGIITISDTIADAIKKEYKRDVAVIPNGVIIPKILRSDTVLEKYGLSEGKYILSVGRFVPEKGFHDLIEAFNKFSAYNAQLPSGNWKLVIVGRADHEDLYSLNLAETAKRNDSIVLTGFLSGRPLRELYSHAGLFVLPSYYEGLPIVLLEAMSYGLSCIASDIPANKNVDLSCDRFFRSGDVDGLASKIKEFFDKPLSEKEKRSQTNMIAKRYDWGMIAKKTMKMYKNVVRGL